MATRAATAVAATARIWDREHIATRHGFPMTAKMVEQRQKARVLGENVDDHPRGDGSEPMPHYEIRDPKP